MIPDIDTAFISNWRGNIRSFPVAIISVAWFEWCVCVRLCVVRFGLAVSTRLLPVVFIGRSPGQAPSRGLSEKSYPNHILILLTLVKTLTQNIFKKNSPLRLI